MEFHEIGTDRLEGQGGVNTRRLLGAVGMVLVGILAIYRTTRRTTVEASPTELRVTSQGIWSRSRQIPADELQSLDIESSEPPQEGTKRKSRPAKVQKWLVALSDDTLIRFGTDLKEQDLEWLRGVILYAIAGRV